MNSVRYLIVTKDNNGLLSQNKTGLKEDIRWIHNDYPYDELRIFMLEYDRASFKDEDIIDSASIDNVVFEGDNITMFEYSYFMNDVNTEVTMKFRTDNIKITRFELWELLSDK